MPARTRSHGTIDTEALIRTLRAIRSGDFSVRMPPGRSARSREVARHLNVVIDRARHRTEELRRISRVVGREGKLAERARREGRRGGWNEGIQAVNTLIDDLVQPTSEVARVIGAVARGDLSRKMPMRIRGRPVRGATLQVARTVNTMVAQLGSFASEVTRVAREVGTEGKLGGQAQVKGVAGVWKDLTDSVNFMASNLTSQVRNIADVTTAVARGDLSRKITVEVAGEILLLKNTINTMVDQLNAFASEVTRVAREVGTEGKLGGQAEVTGVGGVWKDLTDNVNLMASNLTGQVRNLADVTTAIARGDLSRKITVEVEGEILHLKDTINTMVDQLNAFASEVTRVAREVGTEGNLGGQAQVRGVAGVWKDLTDNVNSMASNLTNQVRNIAEVTTAVARGDLSRKITVEVRGEILRLKETINTMVDQLNAFASEVTRVAREVGTEGKLGVQAEVRGVAGIWKDLTDNVNFMASNLTNQVRRIAVIVTAVANGELKRKLTLEARGEIATLAETINDMIDTLATFADQVTTVAREVGVEGKLGGQARVPGATGTWRDLTDNVNQLAANLTTQVRAIADVATAVTKGDLTQSISVEARGEVESLKDNINEMIRNLRETTRKNAEEDWLKTNLAKFTRMLQGQRDLETVSRQILSEMAPLVGAQCGAFYTLKSNGDGAILERAGAPVLEPLGAYALVAAEEGGRVQARRFHPGEGLVGQCAMERRSILVEQVPSGYLNVQSGLGQSPPASVVVLPVLFEEEVKAVIELGSFSRFSEIHLKFLEQLTESIGIVLNTIAATMRTEDLLKQSQALAQELQQINAELEEKAEQLARTSKYKSDFLANMSHELRTPLNSLLILARMLSENAEGNLTPRQVEFARGIHSSGSDLLSLINDILDLSKIESGTSAVDVEAVRVRELVGDVELHFRHLAQSRRLHFAVETAPGVPEVIHTDAKRLQQVLRNLLSNAFKFTPAGSVLLRIGLARRGRSVYKESLNRAKEVITFAVSDTGIGIPPEKQRIVFEPFHQADMTTSRQYGGTGLGLSISREIARMLGGEIGLESQPGRGSTFTLYLPDACPPSRPPETAADAPPELAVSPAAVRGVLPPAPLPLPASTDDDRENIQPGDLVLLIVEDNQGFARRVVDAARSCGFRGLIAHGGEAGLLMARRHHPHAITIDIRMTDMDGWALLDYLKHDPETRHIPVQVISVVRNRQRALRLGALGHLVKPVSDAALSAALEGLREYVQRQVKTLLVVEDDEAQRSSIVQLVAAGDVETVEAASGARALEIAGQRRVDCMVVDLRLPDMTGFDLIERLGRETAGPTPPIIVYTGKDLTRQEETWLRKASKAIIVKDVKSPERLLDETALFLHRAPSRLQETQRQLLQTAQRSDPLLAGRGVLIADDDIRNIFALTSVLERSRMRVRHAQNGHEAVEAIRAAGDIDIVLMDIMMPEMDGCEAIRRIRGMEGSRSLPIIALTAKAMKGDRERCLDAGASDYITKPVDTGRLLSLLRVWLMR